MEVQDYCTNVATELSGWKAKMSDVAGKFDKLPTGQKEKFTSQVSEIHMIIEGLSDRIEKLQKECPTSWKPDEQEIKASMVHMKEIMNEVWDPLTIGK